MVPWAVVIAVGVLECFSGRKAGSTHRIVNLSPCRSDRMAFAYGLFRVGVLNLGYLSVVFLPLPSWAGTAVSVPSESPSPIL